MKLLFQNSQGKERVVAEVNSFAEAVTEINKFCDERNFDIPYMRIWGSLDEDGIWFDVSSWSEFFILKRNE